MPLMPRLVVERLGHEDERLDRQEDLDGSRDLRFEVWRGDLEIYRPVFKRMHYPSLAEFKSSVCVTIKEGPW